MENKPRKLIKMKVIFVDQKKKDGTTFKVMKTIINNNGKEVWATIKFGDAVNTKVWKNENQVIYAPNIELENGEKNIKIPKSFEPYISKKDGQKKYPYIFIYEIDKAEKLVSNYKPSNNYVDANDITFDLDEEDTEHVELPNTDGLPFD